jgi:hypothetical protein
VSSSTIRQNTTGLEEILDTINDLPEAGGGGEGGTLVQQQADYEENDTSKVTYIKNRPFYRESYSYEWDGTAPDESKKVSGNDSRFFYYKISDNIMAASDLVGAKITTSANQQATIADEHIKIYENGSFVYKYANYYELLFVCVEAGSFSTQMGTLELTPGLWFIYPGIYIKSLQGEATAKQLDNRYIPKATAIDEANADLPVTAGLLKTELENVVNAIDTSLSAAIGSGVLE